MTEVFVEQPLASPGSAKYCWYVNLFVARMNVASDPVVRNEQPLIICKRCDKVGWNKGDTNNL